MARGSSLLSEPDRELKVGPTACIRASRSASLGLIRSDMRFGLFQRQMGHETWHGVAWLALYQSR